MCGRGLALTNALLIHPRIADWRRADAFLLEGGDVLVGGVVRDVGSILVHPGQDEVVLIEPGAGVGKCQGLEARNDDKGEVHIVYLM